MPQRRYENKAKKIAKKVIKEIRYRAPDGSSYSAEQLERRRSVFFEPVTTKEELQFFLRMFFNIELPDYALDEMSTSTPLQLVWETYQTMMTNIGPKSHVVASSRNAGKTLCASLIIFLSMVHFRRQCLHMAAIRSQAAVAMRYMSGFCRLPEVADYFVADNSTHRRLEGLPPNSFTKKDNAEVVIIAANLKGANANRANCVIMDEIDQLDRMVIAEVAGVLDPTLDEYSYSPITIGLSSRKSNDGPLQDDLNTAEADMAAGKPVRIRAHRFSMVDWMKRCRNPGAPAGTLHVNIDNLQIIWSDGEYEGVPDSEKGRYKAYQYYENCRQCPIAVVCLGRSAKQVETSPRLRDIETNSTILAAVKDAGVIAAQYCNWCPETTGLVFRAFAPYRHITNMVGMWEWVTKKKWPDVAQKPTLQTLVAWMKANGWIFTWGVDWGAAVQAACVVMAYHEKEERCAVLRVLALGGYSNHHWAEYCASYIPEYLRPYLVCPDTEDASSHTYFNKFGLKSRRTKPKKIFTGVSQIRGLLWNPHTQSSHFMALLDEADPHIDGMKVFIQQMGHWKHKKTPVGGWDMYSFEDGSDHCLDSWRYGLDIFQKTRPKAGFAIDTKAIEEAKINEQHQQNIPQALIDTYRDNGSPYAFDEAASREILKNSKYAHLVQDLSEAPIKDTKRKQVRFSF